ncbi:hypothetical protein [Aeromonas sp. MrichA-1]|uniref:hypothetical protein n=1 Tax=Aeromonas sp. MrichA-1 TaxID=2823362 RepID=UPI001B321E2C|nr:hypothetical protein [Aeromonas sp. MrichA-1]MBP4081337.1 hypothetical protein [Aeromonas sp. MrichA-1]
MKTLPQDIKMASFFALPLERSVDGAIGDVVDRNGESVFYVQDSKSFLGKTGAQKVELRNQYAEAAAMAVNSHDDLISQIEQLTAEIAGLKAKLAEKQ